MIPVKLNGVQYKFPTDVRELTLGQFFALRESKNVIEEICAVTGMDSATLSNFKSMKDIEEAHRLLSILADSIEKGFNGSKLPKTVVMGGKELSVPKKLKLEPIGAFISVNNILADEANKFEASGAEPDYTNRIPEVIAHYFYCLYTEELYSDEKAEGEEFMKVVNTMKFTEAVPIANFFFRKFPHLI